jgi:hypothetical protein
MSVPLQGYYLGKSDMWADILMEAKEHNDLSTLSKIGPYLGSMEARSWFE